MAIIYTYPKKSSVAANDTFIITDSSDNSTKVVTAQSVADYVGGTVTLQEVLQTGSSATGNTGNTWAGDMSLTQGGTIILPQVARKFEVNLNGLAGSGNSTAYLIGNLQLASNGAADLGDIDASGSLELGASATVGASLTVTTTSTLTGNTTIGNVAGLPGSNNLKVGNGITFGGALGSPNAFVFGADYDGTGNSTSDFGAGYIQFTTGAAASTSIINQGTGPLTLSRANGVANLGNIIIGGNSTAEIDITATGTGGIIDMNADDGITIDNFTTGNIAITNSSATGTLNLQAFNDINLTSTGHDINITTTNQDKEIIINAGNKLQLKAESPATYVKVQAVNFVAEGTGVYIASDAGGVINVDECDPETPSQFPAFGIVTTVGGIAGGATGEIVIQGVHEFSAGTIINPGVANDPVYIDSGAAITTIRPSNNIGTNRNFELQVIGRVIDGATPDKLYINCVGYQAPELITGFFTPELWTNNAGTQIPTLTARGYYQVLGRHVTGHVIVDVNNPATPILNNFSCRFALGGGAYLDDLNNYPATNLLPGSIMINQCFFADPFTAPTAGAIATSNGRGVNFKRLADTPGALLNLTPNIAAGNVALGDNIAFSFSYYTEK